MLTIAYVNFWNQNMNMIQDFWLSEFIRHNIDPNIKLVNYNQNPDILIASCFGNIDIIKNINAKVKIFFYGENLNRYSYYNNHTLLKNTFDLIVGFKYTNITEKIVRFPLWLTYYPFYNYTEEVNILKYLQESYNKNINTPEKNNNASLISRHDSNGLRTKIYNEISKYTNVLCPGTFKNNTAKIGQLNQDKINFISKTTFNICPENSEFEGYHTEKIFHALEAGCIPIYWAIDRPEKDIIDKDCYCWANPTNVDEFEKNIKDVIENKKKYIKENIFTTQAKYVIDNFYKTLKEEIKKKLNRIPKQKIYAISYASRDYADRYAQITHQAINSKFFDEFKCWREEDIDEEFKITNASVWNDSTKGGGWWIWKPYIIYKQLEKMNDNDILIYFDSGCTINATQESLKRINNYKDMVNDHWSGLLRFQLLHPECKFTNKYTVDYFSTKFNINMDEHIKSNQILTTIIIMRKNKYVLDFFKQVLEILNDDPFLFTDKFNKNNETHRHDQSIMSLLYKIMNGSLILEDETYFNNGHFDELNAINYPFLATRQRK
jgi:hypothetical protein